MYDVKYDYCPISDEISIVDDLILDKLETTLYAVSEMLDLTGYHLAFFELSKEISKTLDKIEALYPITDKDGNVIR